MNLLCFSMIILLFPVASIANPPTIVRKKPVSAIIQKKPVPVIIQKKTVSAITQKRPVLAINQKRSLRRPTSAESLIDLKPLVHPSSITIEPKIPLITPPKSNGPTHIKLLKVQSKNQLTLSFESSDRHLKLNMKAPLAVQLFTDYPLQLDRTLIIGSTWPKDGTPLTLTFSDATPKIQNKIRGKASYTYCHETTLKCKAILEPILFYFIP